VLVGLVVVVVVAGLTGDVGPQFDDCGVVAALGCIVFAVSGATVPFGAVLCCGVYGFEFGIVADGVVVVVTGGVVDGVVDGIVEVVAGAVVVGALNAGVMSAAASNAPHAD
jgi:hypothetical protein